MDQAERVAGVRGRRDQGCRLKPGALVQTQALLAAVAGLDPHDTLRVLDRLHVFASEDRRVTGALTAIAGEASLLQARLQLGVSERRLQHLLLDTQLPAQGLEQARQPGQ